MTAVRYRIDVVNSPDDRARYGLPYYAEVVSLESFETLFTTELHPCPRDARREANEWCEQNLGQGK